MSSSSISCNNQNMTLRNPAPRTNENCAKLFIRNLQIKFCCFYYIEEDASVYQGWLNLKHLKQENS